MKCTRVVSAMEMLSSTFGNERVSVCAGEGAVNLTDQLHVVEEGVEGIEVGEAHQVGGAASCSLEKQSKSVIPFTKIGSCYVSFSPDLLSD